MNLIGKGLIIFGLMISLIGVLMTIAPKIPYLGKLPGDFAFQMGSVKIFFPLATCLLLSLILSVILNMLTTNK